jgi:SAM-dependent methyltransferase
MRHSLAARAATLFVTAAVAVALAAPVLGRQGDDAPATRRPDVVYLPTPQEVVDRMLQLAEIRPDDVLYDLGCGDGRIVVTAARRHGVKAVGLDIDPRRVRESRENARASGVADRVTIRQEDLFLTDLSPATVVTLYLLPNLNARLIPRLARLRPGSRVVSHSFALPGVTARRVEKVALVKGGFRTVYLYSVPLERDPSR